jgi:hypothetical protein
VGDPREQVLGQPVRVGDERAGEHRHRTRQRLLLRPLGLVPAVEQPVEQPRVLAEQVPVEALGDLPDVLAHHRQRRFERAGTSRTA